MRITKDEAMIRIAKLEEKFGFKNTDGTAQLERLVKRYARKNEVDIESAKIEAYVAYGEYYLLDEIAFD